MERHSCHSCVPSSWILDHCLDIVLHMARLLPIFETDYDENDVVVIILIISLDNQLLLLVVLLEEIVPFLAISNCS